MSNYYHIPGVKKEDDTRTFDFNFNFDDYKTGPSHDWKNTAT